jgi:hypothetical protein
MYKSLDTVYLEKIFGSIHKQANVARIPRFLIPKPKKVTLTSMSYDDVIEKAFKDNLQELNDIKGIDLKSTKINPVDRSVWFKLFELSPPKKNETEGSTKGSGFGELAIYWFLKKTNPSIQDNRYSKIGAADMVIGDVGIEVKAYPIGATDIKIGKFRSAGKEEGKKNNIILNTVLGLNTLMSKISLSESDIKIAKKEGLTNDAGNFRYNTLFTAFEKIDKLHKVIENEPMLQSFNVFEYLKNNIDTVYRYLNVPYTNDIKKFASDNAKQLLWNFTRAKLLDKPGVNGYIVNCDKQGNMEWLYIDKNLLSDISFPAWFKGDEAYAAAGELYINKGFFNR